MKRINIVFASDYFDGLFFYSYEHFRFLEDNGFDVKFHIFLRPVHTKNDFLNMLLGKYSDVSLDNIHFYDNNSSINTFHGINFMLGESHLYHTYNRCQNASNSMHLKINLKMLMHLPIVIIHNENRPEIYPVAIKYFDPDQVFYLNDYDIYPNGYGQQYMKRINFDIYLPQKDEIEFTHLFNGSNDQYYESALKVIDEYPDSRVLVSHIHDDKYRDKQILIPVEKLMNKFEKFVYTKDFFDPAPRIIQECFHYGKEVIYRRNLDIADGGSVYYQRGLDGMDFNLSHHPEILEILKNV